MNRKWLAVVFFGLGIAILMALASPLASSNPDGLERVAEDKEFIDAGKEPSYEIIPDYTFPGIENEALATIVSGIVGVVIVAAIGFGAAYAMKSLRANRTPPTQEPS